MVLYGLKALNKVFANRCARHQPMSESGQQDQFRESTAANRLSIRHSRRITSPSRREFTPEGSFVLLLFSPQRTCLRRALATAVHARPRQGQARTRAESARAAGLDEGSGTGGARRPVSRVLYPPWLRRAMAIHLGRPLPDASRDRPGRRRGKPAWRRKATPCHPYLVLLPVGFTVPFPSPGTRCALTAPFHPCRRTANRGAHGPGPAVCFLWHCPWGRPRRALPGTVFSVEPGLSSPARPSRRAEHARAAIRPSGTIFYVRRR